VSTPQSSGEVVPLRGRANVDTVAYDVVPSARGDAFTRPTQIGRYQILDVIGMGGMGIVCTAYDAKLDRKVAIKLLRDQSRQDLKRRSMGQARLVREAQALAKLAHPNVITVHDVDTWEDNLYMAMEYVKGRSLAEWMEEKPRSWREVVQHFLAAGRGLAAAHAAGIIHRDFKPQNVLLGDDGRVRVVDFGLAKSAEEARSVAEAAPEDGGSLDRSADSLMQIIGSTSGAKLTQLGRAVGTPAYMAPEQHLGEAMSEATDQFSFGVSLWEALYGDLPFRGKDPFWEATAGKVQDPPEGTEVPAWLHQVLLRTLEPDPEKRFASMGALLAALGDDPAKRRRRWFLGAGVLGVGGLGAMLGIWAIGTERPCQGAAARLGEAWTPERMDTVRGAFLQTDVSYASDTWERVAATLDAHASEWVATYRAVCEATHVHGEQSEILLDVRMTCLDRRRSELAALVEVLADADVRVVEQAVSAAHALTRPNECAFARDDAATAVPDDPELRTRVEVAQAELDRAHALHSAGKYQSAATLAAGAVESAEVAKHPPTRGRALLLSGLALSELGEGDAAEARLGEAIMIAAESGDATVEAAAWILLVYVVGDVQQRYEAGLAWELPARAAIQRAGSHPDHEADLNLKVGVVLDRAGRLTEALERQERAVAVMRTHHGTEHPRLQASIGNLGVAHARLGRYDEAEPLMREALALSRSALGREHPAVAKNAQNLGNLVLARGDLDEAAELFGEALSIHQKALGRGHPLAVDVMIQLGRVHRDRGEYEAAQAVMEEALALSEASDNPVRVERALANLGFLLMRAGRPADAEVRFLEALEISAAVQGEDHLRTALAYGNVCRARLEQDRAAEALAHCERAEALTLAIHEEPHMDTAAAKLARARAIAATRPAEAVRLAREGMEVARAAPHSEHQLTSLELDLARVLEDTRSDRTEVEDILARARSASAGAPDIRVKLRHWDAR
jgi:eukaryotic-like serine/threonine-protein kinase